MASTVMFEVELWQALSRCDYTRSCPHLSHKMDITIVQHSLAPLNGQGERDITRKTCYLLFAQDIGIFARLYVLTNLSLLPRNLSGTSSQQAEILPSVPQSRLPPVTALT